MKGRLTRTDSKITINYSFTDINNYYFYSVQFGPFDKYSGLNLDDTVCDIDDDITSTS